MQISPAFQRINLLLQGLIGGSQGKVLLLGFAKLFAQEVYFFVVFFDGEGELLELEAVVSHHV